MGDKRLFIMTAVNPLLIPLPTLPRLEIWFKMLTLTVFPEKSSLFAEKWKKYPIA